MVIGIQEDRWEQKFHFATAPKAETELGIWRIEGTNSKSSKQKWFNVMQIHEHETTRCPHSTLRLANTFWGTLVIKTKTRNSKIQNRLNIDVVKTSSRTFQQMYKIDKRTTHANTSEHRIYRIVSCTWLSAETAPLQPNNKRIFFYARRAVSGVKPNPALTKLKWSPSCRIAANNHASKIKWNLSI